jgi:predicted MarR family transcription regulator
MTSRLDTEAATRRQVGAVAGAFQRLGVRDRAQRLRLSAELLDLDDDLGSTYDLTKGQAGKLLAIVRGAPDLASLRETAAAAAAARQRANRRNGQGGLLGLVARAIDALTTAPKGT